jgi:hypothetical protein
MFDNHGIWSLFWNTDYGDASLYDFGVIVVSSFWPRLLHVRVSIGMGLPRLSKSDGSWALSLKSYYLLVYFPCVLFPPCR